MQFDCMKSQLVVHDDDKLNVCTSSVTRCRKTLGKINFPGCEKNAAKKWRCPISHARYIIRTKNGEKTNETKNDNELNINLKPRRYPNWSFITKNTKGKSFSKMQKKEYSMAGTFTQQNHYETFITDNPIDLQKDPSNSSYIDEITEVISSCLKGNASFELAGEDNLLLQELIGCAAPWSKLEGKGTTFPTSKPTDGQSAESSAKLLNGAGKRGSGIHWKKVDEGDSSRYDSSKLGLTRFSDSFPQVRNASTKRTISRVESVKRRSCLSSCA